MADTKQDKEAVAFVIEAIVMRLKVDLPHIERTVFQFDNAPSYQNTFILLLLPLVSAFHEIQVTRFAHSETQDGKSILDAHFARAMQLLLAWMRGGNDFKTPTQAVVGLTSRGGLRNCVVQLVTHDRVALQKLVKAVVVIEKVVRRYVECASDIQFDLLHGDLLG